MTVEVAFALDAKVAHNEFDGMAESEMGLCLLDVKPPCNLLRKAPWEAVIEVRGAGLRPVRRNVVLYPNEQNDLVLETEPPFKWPWRGSDTVKIKPHVPVPTR